MSFPPTISPPDYIRTNPSNSHSTTQTSRRITPAEDFQTHSLEPDGDPVDATPSSLEEKFAEDVGYFLNQKHSEVSSGSSFISSIPLVPLNNVSDWKSYGQTPSKLSSSVELSTATFRTTIQPITPSHYDKPAPHHLLALSSTTSTTTIVATSSNSSSSLNLPSYVLPAPDWPHALREWGIFWHLYIWGFAILFLAISASSAVIVFRFRVRAHRLRVVCNTLILVGVAGLMRVALLVVGSFSHHDNSNTNKMAALAIGLLTQGAYPLICASYGLTQVSIRSECLALCQVPVSRTLLCHSNL